MRKIRQFTVYGERCSGTNWLEKLISDNFDLELTWKFGFKHFFGASLLPYDTSECIFLGIVRDPYDWVGSFFKNPHHVPESHQGSMMDFVSKEWYSIYDLEEHKKNGNFGKEIVYDRHLYEGRRYFNLIELRNTKNAFLLYALPKMVLHSMLINYDEAIKDAGAVIERIGNYLSVRPRRVFVDADPKHGGKFEKTEYEIPDDVRQYINSNLSWRQENLLGFREERAR